MKSEQPVDMSCHAVGFGKIAELHMGLNPLLFLGIKHQKYRSLIQQRVGSEEQGESHVTVAERFLEPVGCA